MNLLLDALGSFIRWLLTFGAGWFVAHHVWTQDAANSYVNAASGAVALALLQLAWSFWQKYAAHLKVLTALNMPAGSTVAQLNAKVDSGLGAKLVVALLVVTLGGAAVTSTGCAGNPTPSTAPVLPAVKATEVVHALDAARDIAKVVSDAYPTVITPADFQQVLAFHTEAVTIIGATPNGWKATVETALDQLPKNLSPAAAARLQPYLALVKTLVDAFVATPPDPLLPAAIDASLSIDRALL